MHWSRGVERAVYIYIGVVVENETGERGQELLDGVLGRWRLLAATQVDNDPRDVAQERERYLGPDEREQRLDHAQPNNQIAALRSVSFSFIQTHTK